MTEIKASEAVSAEVKAAVVYKKCDACGGDHSTDRCRAHLMPSVILQIQRSRKSRFEAHFERNMADVCQVVPTESLGDVVFLRCKPEDRARVLKTVWTEESFHRFVSTVYTCQHASRNLQEVVDYIASAAAGKCFRVHALPKTAQEELVKLLPMHVKLHPKQFTHVIVLVKAYSRYYYAIEPKELYYGNPLTTDASDSVVSRAFYKLREAFHVLETEQKYKVPEGARALDIGASPGGWTSFLVSRGIKTLAVDPGELKIDASDLIVHARKRLEAAQAELKEHGPFDLCVCDMNCDPRESSELVVSIADSIKPGGVLIMTLKVIDASRSAKFFDEGSFHALQECTGLFDQMHSRWLFANYRERTLFARRTSKTVADVDMKAFAELRAQQKADSAKSKAARAQQRAKDAAETAGDAKAGDSAAASSSSSDAAAQKLAAEQERKRRRKENRASTRGHGKLEKEAAKAAAAGVRKGGTLIAVRTPAKSELSSESKVGEGKGTV